MIVHLAIYAPSSPQRLMDIAKLLQVFEFVNSLIVIKPVGMAAQIGLAEASKIVYKINKNLIILSSISELSDVINYDKVIFVLPGQRGATDIENLFEEITDKRIVLVFRGGETTISKQDLAIGTIATIDAFAEIDVSSPIAEVGITLYKLWKRLGQLRQVKSFQGSSVGDHHPN